MQLTIRTRMFGFAVAAFVFVAAVSTTGYWGMSSLDNSTSELAAIGGAIRSHTEAGVFNDLTHSDILAVFKAKDEDQTRAAEELKRHSELLQDRIASTLALVKDPATRAMLEQERQMAAQYVQAGESSVDALLHRPSEAPQQMFAYLQLYKDLQVKIEVTSDQLSKRAKETELGAKNTVARGMRALFAICGVSLLILLLGSVVLVRQISQSLKRLIDMIRDIAEGEGDITRRLDVANEFGKDELGEVSQLFNLFMDKLQDILRGIVSHTTKLNLASRQLLEASKQITSNSQKTAGESKSVSRAAQQVTENLNNLSRGAGEMTTTIQKIAGNAQQAARVASSAVSAAQSANGTMSSLGKSSAEIGKVIKVITSIAQQTNLLALNATIEAARAGEAGKGFAVVANEVKELARQTAKATSDIGGTIAAIQEDTRRAVSAIETVGGVIKEINDISGIIAVAVEEQGATTTNMTHDAGEAARSAGEISLHISGVAQAADGTSSRAKESEKAAYELSAIAMQLDALIRRFRIERGEPRVDMVLPVRLRGIDATGRSIDQQVMTMNISHRGVHVTGVKGKFGIGEDVSLLRGGKTEKYRIQWVSDEGSPSAGHIGLCSTEPEASLWNDVIGTQTYAEEMRDQEDQEDLVGVR